MSPLAYKRLQGSLYAVFRYLILSLMPAEELGNHFDEAIGRPTKELYSMAGLILLKEFHNWTTIAAVDGYLFDKRVHYALNLISENVSFCERTLERYMKLIRENEFASGIFDTVTEKLIEELELEVDQQRLDSTHIFSDMATFARTKLMGITIKRFAIQLKRHHAELYIELPEEMRNRYEKNDNSLFADVSKNKEKRSSLRQDVAEQMYFLIQEFSGNSTIENMKTFKDLVKVFNQQCEVKDTIDVESSENENEPQTGSKGDKTTPHPEVDEKEQELEDIVEVRKKTGGNVIQNSSDPDATYDGHKGVGFQAQLTETYNSDNEVQLITSVLPQTAVESDANAVNSVLDILESRGHIPEVMLADSLYGSDDNVLLSACYGVNLISPVSGAPPKDEPEKPDEKQLRLQARRKAQDTDEWRTEYNKRAQEEGTIGSIKRKTGMVRLRYRGEKSVYTSIYLKVTGWNISRAATSVKIQKKIAKIIKERKAQLNNPCSISSSCLIHLSETLKRVAWFTKQPIWTPIKSFHLFSLG